MALIERIFLGWGRPILPLAADFLIGRYGSEGVADLRDVHVVLTGGRAGRRLREVLVEAADRHGVRLVPPRVVTAGDLPELLYTPRLPRGDGILLRRVWAKTLRGAGPDPVSFLFGRAPAAADHSAWNRLAGRLEVLQRAVAAGGHTFADVAADCSIAPGLLYDDSERWGVLGELQGAYARRLQAVGFSDPDLERIARIRTAEPAAAPEIWLVGVAELPRAARRFLELAQGRVGALVHAPAEEVEGFDELGLVAPEYWSERVPPLDREQLRTVDGPADQAAVVLEEAAAVGSVKMGQVVVGHTTTELVPYLSEALAAAGIPAHDAAGIPIALTGPFRLLETVAEYLDGRHWEHLASLARHPDFVAWLARARGPGLRGGTPEALDRLFGNHLPSVARANAAGGSAELSETVRSLDALLFSALSGERVLREWPVAIAGLLSAVYGARALLPDRASDRRTVEVLQKLRSALLELRRLPPEVDEPCDVAEAIRILLESVRRQVVPEEPEGPAVELLGWLELAADDAQHVFLAGVNEGYLPESINADGFLPDSLRSRLGIQNNAGRFGRDAFLLTALVNSRATVRLISGRLSPSGDPLRVSRFLMMGPGDRVAQSVLEYLAPVRKDAPGEVPLVAQAGRISRCVLPPTPVLHFSPPDEMAVTAFRAFLEDPYRFVLERLLGLRAAGDEAREMDPLLFGDLTHEVLARFGRSQAAHSTEAREVRTQLDAMLAEEILRRFGSAPFPAVSVQLEQLRARLSSFAEWQAARVREGWRVVMVEGVQVPSALGTAADEDVGRVTTVEFLVDGRPIVLRGRIDRIDHHPASGRWALLDYKTSDRPETPVETHGGTQNRRWRDLQLPLYRHLATAVRTPEGEPLIPLGSQLDLGYIVLSRGLDRVRMELGRWKEDELARADEEAANVVRELRRGEVRFDADRVAVWPGDPLGPLLGLRQLVADAEDEVLLEEVDA